MRRRVLPVTAVVAMVASAALTGCSASSTAEDCEALFGPGALSDSVKVSGDSADTLKIDLNQGGDVLSTQRSVLTEGEQPGEVVEQGSIVAANLAFVDSSSGEVLQVSPGFGGENGESLFLADPEVGSIVAATICAHVGDTVAVALSNEESATMGVQAPIVVVAEIRGAYDTRAEGRARALPSGFPAVTTDHTGQPGVVLPPQDAPSKTRTAVRIEGTGEKVAADQRIVGQVLTVGWDGEERKNTWAQGPEAFGTEDEPEVSFRKQLTGHPVGSQVVVIEAGESGPQVSVVDILAVF